MRTTKEKEAGRMAFEAMVEATTVKNEYKKSRIEIQNKIDQLQKLLNRLDRGQKQNSDDWGYVGTANHIKVNITDCVNSLANISK